MKTKAIILVVLYSIITLCTTGCASGQISKKKMDVGSFSKIASSSGIDVYYTQSSKCSLEIDADAENLSKIEYKVENGALQLKRKDGTTFKKNSRIIAYITAPTLGEIAMSGGADFETKELTNKSIVSIAASGGSDVKIEKLQVPVCNLAFSGGADCNIKHLQTDNLNLAASGGSDSDINLVNSNSVNVAISGGADAKLTGKVKHINLNCSGGADADIRGLSYESITDRKSGGGSIYK